MTAQGTRTSRVRPANYRDVEPAPKMVDGRDENRTVTGSELRTLERLGMSEIVESPRFVPSTPPLPTSGCTRNGCGPHL